LGQLQQVSMACLILGRGRRGRTATTGTTAVLLVGADGGLGTRNPHIGTARIDLDAQGLGGRAHADVRGVEAGLNGIVQGGSQGVGSLTECAALQSQRAGLELCSLNIVVLLNVPAKGAVRGSEGEKGGGEQEMGS